MVSGFVGKPLASLRGRLSIGARVSLAVAAVAGAVLAVFVTVDAFQTHKELHEFERRVLRSSIPPMARVVESAMLRANRGHIAEVFTELQGLGAFRAVELLDAERRVVRTQDFLEGRDPPRRLPPAVLPDHAESVEMPLMRRAECSRCHAGSGPRLGYVRVVADLPRAWPTLIRHAKIRAAMAALALAAVGFLCAALVRVMVDAPVREVARALEQVREGRLETRLRADLPGELAVISNRFNTMAEELERDRRQISELHRRQVMHLDRLAAMGELAANFAHEVRNPLTGIGSSIQVFRRGLAEGDGRREVLAKALDQVDRLNRTIDSFLRYSRMPDAEVRPFDLRDPLQRAELLLNPRMSSQRVEFSADLPAGLPLVAGDPGQMEQVLLNLCLNALQAMPDGGTLRVRATPQTDGDIFVEVRDTGCGIPPEALEKVFQPFVTTRKDGSGLGLPISRQIVENIGGELWLESVPGSGTAAFLRLPRHREEEA